MLTLNNNFKANNDALAKWPVYVAEIFFNRGNAGTDGVNDIYFATCDVNEITGFAYADRWFPFLKADSIGSMSQTVDPINGVSSIGNLNVTITDYHGMVSDIIKAADAAGHGLRRQRISIFMLYRGMDWADRVCVRTMQVNDLKLSALNEYKLTAADVQRQMQKTVFNPYATAATMAVTGTGAMTLTVVDARNFTATAQQTYGTSGFIKMNEEIMRWTAKTDTSFTIGAGDRGLFGSTATTHADGDKVGEIVVLRENPITMALKVMQSTGDGSNGTWDTYPARWGCGMDSANDVYLDEWLEIGKLLTGLADSPAASEGTQFEFVFDKGVEAKKFIEDQILKILGAFGFVHGDGRYGIRAYSDLSNAAKENAALTADQNSVIKWGDLSYNYNDLANQVWIEYDEAIKLSGKFIRNTVFIDEVSVRKWGEARQLKYSASGIIPTSTFASQLYQRFQRIIARYSRPPMQIELTLLPKFHTMEIGDIVRITLNIRDLFTGATLDRAFEVISTHLKVDTGEIVIKCLAQPEAATFWFGGVGEVYSVTISPASSSAVSGATQQLTARSFDGLGNQVPTPAISWIVSGNVTVDSNGLVTAGAVGSGTVVAVVGSKQSNVATITVTAAPNVSAVARVSVSPSTVTLSATQTQQITAQALDITGAQVNGKVFNWASSNVAVATVPAGPSASVIVTAVANGSANITAQESMSLITSAVVPVTVATPSTPDFTPPLLLDSAYQIGTQITAHGPIGGPHVIPNGYSFASGDYWYDGDVSLAISTTCTINGTVRLFSTGVITINGTIDGTLRGTSHSTSGASNVGANGTACFVGKAGTGGSLTRGGVGMRAGDGAAPLFNSQPTLTFSATSISGGSWVGVSGLPSNLQGGSSGCGVIYDPNAIPLSYTSQYAGGAGLLLMARGIYITAGTVDLRGYPFTSPGVGDRRQAHRGGSGGGSFVALAERNIYGLPVMTVGPNQVLTVGGFAVTSIEASSINSSSTLPGNSGYGAIYKQVIG